MNNIILSSLLIFLFIGCVEPSKKDGSAKGGSEDFSLVGTWRLSKYIDHPNGGTEWESYPESVIYQKYITPDHFTWISYETDNNNLVGMGGGTYDLVGQVYTEKIKFFLPPGSNELGQSIPFKAEFKDGKWYHTGYAKVMEFDAEKAENVIVDSSKIEEIWVKVENDPVSKPEIHGTWELISYQDEETDQWMEYPNFVRYIKLITPTHFVWVKYNSEGDEVLQAGAGPYDFRNGKYFENIRMIYKGDLGLVGTSVPFEFNLNERGVWKHKGVLISDSEQQNDSTMIMEKWQKISGKSS